MNSKIRNRIILAAAIIFGACSPTLYLPTINDASRAGISTDSLMAGRTLYINHCGSCHNLHLPEQYTQAHWEKVMPGMRLKAKISEEEAKLISNFVLARCKPD
ncbi:c-type cytochrome [Aquipluma nitroreducens]|nr:cytochrome c [Aquipluma nitroreducens]